jgi:hypothetical protein
MMISKEQARAAAIHLRTCASPQNGHAPADVSPEIVAAAFAVAANTPDTSPERIAEAEHYLAGVSADSHAVASMMIQRIISDALR